MITIVAGTHRPGSRTKVVAGHVLASYQALGVPAQVLDLADLPLEAFAGAAFVEKPTSLAPFLEMILGSSGVVWVVPEYNGGAPGVLKHFIDLLPFPEAFDHRPMAFVGLAAGQWGALRAIEQLQQIVGYRNAYAFPDRVFIAAVHQHLGSDGTWVGDALPKRLARQAEGFAAFVQAVAK